jgi:hypothetical protein
VSGAAALGALLGKCQKHLEETCLKNAYCVKHKLRDCGIMKNFMASGSLTQGMDDDKVPKEGNTTLTRVGTWGTTSHGLGMSKEGSFMSRLTI